MLYPGADFGYAPIAALLAFRQRLTWLTFALNVQPPPLLTQAPLSLAIHVALVGPDIRRGHSTA